MSFTLLPKPFFTPSSHHISDRWRIIRSSTTTITITTARKHTHTNQTITRYLLSSLYSNCQCRHHRRNWPHQVNGIMRIPGAKEKKETTAAAASLNQLLLLLPDGCSLAVTGVKWRWRQNGGSTAAVLNGGREGGEGDPAAAAHQLFVRACVCHCLVKRERERGCKSARGNVVVSVVTSERRDCLSSSSSRGGGKR